MFWSLNGQHQRVRNFPRARCRSRTLPGNVVNIKNWMEGIGADTIKVAPCDPKAAAIVGSLSYSMRTEVQEILRWAASLGEDAAIGSAMTKRDDPWVSAASGLLLVASGQVKELASTAVSHARAYPWLADYKILAAWWQAANHPDNEERCLSYVREARREGQLYFWRSFDLAEQILFALTSGGQKTGIRGLARKEAVIWKRLKSDAQSMGALALWTTSHKAKTAKPSTLSA